ncbi:Vacuolar protein sorting-associated protein 35 [Entamoeba marina]
MTKVFDMIKRVNSIPLTLATFVDDEEIGFKKLNLICSELCKTNISTQDFHLLHHCVTTKLHVLTEYTKRHSDPYSLFIKAQYSYHAISRVYQMIAVASALYDRCPEQRNEIFDDVNSYCRCVQHPIRALFVRLYFNTVFPDPNGSYNYIFSNTIEAIKAILRCKLPIESSEDIKKMSIPCTDIVKTLINKSEITISTFQTSIFPQILGEIINGENEPSKFVILSSILSQFTSTLLISSLNSVISTILQFPPNSSFALLGQISKQLVKSGIGMEMFDAICSTVLSIQDKTTPTQYLSICQTLILEISSKVNATQLNVGATNNLWNLLSGCIESEFLKFLVLSEPFKILLNLLPMERRILAAKKLIDQYVLQSNLLNLHEMDAFLDVVSWVFNGDSEDLLKGLKIFHIINCTDANEVFPMIDRVKFAISAHQKQLSLYIPHLIFTYLNNGQKFTSLQNEVIERIFESLTDLHMHSPLLSIQLASQCCVTFSQWNSKKYEDLLQLCWICYEELSNSKQQETALLTIMGIVKVLQIPQSQFLELRSFIEEKSVGLLRTYQKCEVLCKCASLSSQNTVYPDWKHSAEVLCTSSKLGSNIIESQENIKLFVLLLNYLIVYYHHNKYLPDNVINRLLILIKDALIGSEDLTTIQFFSNTLHDIMKRRNISNRFNNVDLDLLKH